MEISTKFELNEWDTRSKTSTLHLSYLIQLLLPIRHVGWKKENKFHIPFRISEINGIDHVCIPTGSTSEGLNIPRCIVTGSNPSTFEVFSDTDLLCVPNKIIFCTQPITGPDRNFDGYFDDEGVAPGYTRICVTNDGKLKSMSTFDSKRGKHYLNSNKFLQGAYSSAKHLLERTKDTSRQGPALSVTEDELVKFDGTFDPYAGVSKDIVLAVPCYPWPLIANKWKNRVIRSPWLHKSLVESIIQEGCHVVGVSSKSSLNPDVEWRISFSASEGRLAREGLTDYQRQCYLYIKILRHQVMKPEPVLSSYIFKSVFFHCCEKLPLHYWRDHPGSCVVYMLDVIAECLKRKHVPTYFVPENNLIRHISEAEIQKALSCLQKLRSDPVTPVLEFTRKRSFAYHSLIAPFASMVKPLMEDAVAFARHRNKETSVKAGFLSTAVTICHLYLNERMDDKYKEFERQKHQEAIETLVHFYTNWLERVETESLSVSYFIASVGYEIEDSKLAIAFYEAVVSLGTRYPELLELKGNLACLYHVHAYTLPCDKGRDAFLRKADALFSELHNDGFQSVIDYATYLLKEKRYEEAQCALEDFIGKANETSDTIYTYTTKEIEIIDEELKKHVQNYGFVSGKASSFALYYLVKCLSIIYPPDASTQISAVLSKLKEEPKGLSIENDFDFYQKAKEVSFQLRSQETSSKTMNTNPQQPLLSAATTCMLLVVIPASLLTLIVRLTTR